MTATPAFKVLSSLFRFLVVSLMLFSLPGWAAARGPALPVQCYVKAGATGGANTGTSWTDAFTDLQSALGASSCTEVWVAAGVYRPVSGTDRLATFQLKNGVALYGGFNGTETRRSQRSPATNLTVLSGDIDNNDSQAPVITDLAAVTGNTTNSYQVLNGADGATLDGFTITGGYADGPSGSDDDKGGGMYSMYANPLLANLTFSGNHANDGGGLYVYGNNAGYSPSLADVTFKKNSADHYGGGMYLTNQSSGNPTLTNIVFNGNSAGLWGGGMYNLASNAALTFVNFSGNHAALGGGMFNISADVSLTEVAFLVNSATGYGGGLHNQYGSLELTNVIFAGNSSDDQAGGLYNYSSSPILVNVTFIENKANYGGGIYNNLGNPILTGVEFSGNTADQNGGGMFNMDSSPILTTAIFSGNTAVQFGGGMYNTSSSPALTDVTFRENSADNTGGGVYTFSGSPKLEKVTFKDNKASTSGGGMAYYSSTGSTLANVTFSGNSANWGGGIFTSASNPELNYVTLSGNSALSGGGIYVMSSTPVIRNTILWGNTAPLAGMQVFNETGASSTLDHSVLQGACPPGTTCTNIISSDPLLGTLGEYGGFTPTIPLQDSSPAIDAADEDNCAGTDQRGVARPQGPGCDIGAYEAGVFLPTISGNAGMAYVTITWTGGSMVSSWLGDYKFSVPSGWTGTVTPSKAGYAFIPEAREYTALAANMSAQDFTAEAVLPYSIFLPLVKR